MTKKKTQQQKITVIQTQKATIDRVTFDEDGDLKIEGTYSRGNDTRLFEVYSCFNDLEDCDEDCGFCEDEDEE